LKGKGILMAIEKERPELVTSVDNSVPYPEAPEVDYDNPKQEHFRGVRDPALVAAAEKKRQAASRLPPYLKNE
jgi:hypothetical protein